VFPASCFCLTTGQGAENFITCVLVGFKDHALKRFSSRPSFAGLFRALQSSRRRKHLLDNTRKCSTNLTNPRSHSCASRHVLVFPPNTDSLFLLLKPCHLVTDLFWMLWTVSQVSLTYFTTHSPVKAQ